MSFEDELEVEDIARFEGRKEGNEEKEGKEGELDSPSPPLFFASL